MNTLDRDVLVIHRNLTVLRSTVLRVKRILHSPTYKTINVELFHDRANLVELGTPA